MSVHKHHPLMAIRRHIHVLLTWPLLVCLVVLIWAMVGPR